MPPVKPQGQPFHILTALVTTFLALTVTGCDLDLDVRAHADVRLDDSHTLHVSYRSGGASNGRDPSHP
jgi:hypothetical protein